MSSNVIYLPNSHAYPPAPPLAAPRICVAAESTTLRPALASFGLDIEGPVYFPRLHRPGSPGFRYLKVAGALHRMAALWHPLLGPASIRSSAPWLSIHLSQAPSQLAVHEPGRLVIGDGASPQAAARAMGSAILNVLRPELWNVARIVSSSFRRGFADAAALLAKLHQCSDAPERLAARRHATTGFGTTIADVVERLATSTGAARRTAAHPAERTALLLAQAVRRADLAMDFVPQVAAEMVLLAWRWEGAKLGEAMGELFAQNWLLASGSVIDQAAAREHIHQHHASRAATTWIALDGGVIGCDRPVTVCVPAHLPRFAFERPPGAATVPEPVQGMRSFLKYLETLKLIEKPQSGTRRPKPAGTNLATTAVLVKDGPALRLRRLRFLTA